MCCRPHSSTRRWTCSGSAGGVCGAASGTGDIVTTVDLPDGASVTYSLTATIAAGATGISRQHGDGDRAGGRASIPTPPTTRRPTSTSSRRPSTCRSPRPTVSRPWCRVPPPPTRSPLPTADRRQPTAPRSAICCPPRSAARRGRARRPAEPSAAPPMDRAMSRCWPRCRSAGRSRSSSIADIDPAATGLRRQQRHRHRADRRRSTPTRPTTRRATATR